MPNLGALPVELMLLVLKYTDPEDLESLSRIDSSWYRTANKLLRQHKERKSKYAYMDYFCCWRDVVVCILRDPHTAHYIKDIEVDYDWTLFIARCLKSLPAESPDAELLIENLDSSVIVPESDIDDWKRDAINGDQIIVSMLLYTLLLKLQKLCIWFPTVGVDRDARLFARTLSAIATAHHHKVKQTPALGSLRYISLHSRHWTTIDRWSEADFLSPLLALPHISAIRLCTIQMPPLERSPEFPSSVVTSLILRDCVADRDVISTLLSSTPCLQRFSFLSVRMGTSGYDCQSIFNALRIHHSRSLQFLGFNVRQSDPSSRYHRPYKVLGSFENLKAAYIPWALFAGSFTNNPLLTKTLLPNLRLLSIADGLHNSVADSFCDFVRKQTSRFPSLKRLLCTKPYVDHAFGLRYATEREKDCQKRLEHAAAGCGLDLEFRDSVELQEDIVGGLNERWRIYL